MTEPTARSADQNGGVNSSVGSSPGPSPSVAPATSSGHRERNALVATLAVTSGATDAIGFLALGGAFTSVMTGNLVLLGVGIGEADFAAAGFVCIAIVSFMLGAAVGARVAGTPAPGDSLWPAAVTRALTLELLLFAAFAVVWWVTGAQPHQDVLVALLALNAAALGLQSSAIQRFGVSGLSTTYLTGTLTTVVIRLSHGQGLRSVQHSLVILLCLIVGAGLAVVVLNLAPLLVPLLQLLTLALVLAVARWHRSLAA